MPVFLLVAALSRLPIRAAYANTMDFLALWGGIAPRILRTWIRKTIGSTASFAILVALTVSFNALGDGPAIPYLSGLFDHFGNTYTQWSNKHEKDWSEFRDSIRKGWSKEHANEDLIADIDAWNKWKTARGKDSVRIPRTLVFYCAILAMAGLIDLTHKESRSRGALLSALGILSFISFLYIWADRKNSYIHNIILANETLGFYKTPIPESLNNSR